MIESVRIADIYCQFLALGDFESYCQAALDGKKTKHIVTINPEMLLEAQENVRFREALAQADLRVPDGAGVIWARWYLRSQFWNLMPSLVAFMFIEVTRITGIDAISMLSRLCERSGQKVMLIGATADQNAAAREALKKKYSKLKVVSASDHGFAEHGPPDVMKEVAREKPDVALVAYGAPKQALWIQANKSLLQEHGVRVAVGVGGALAIIGEKKSRAPRWLRRHNLEWLWRLWLEPSRYKRIWNATFKFPRFIHRGKLTGS